MLSLHIFVAERHPGQLQYHLNIYFFPQKLVDIQTVRVLLCKKYIGEQNMLPTCNFMFMQPTVKVSTLWKCLSIRSVISVNYHYITV